MAIETANPIKIKSKGISLEQISDFCKIKKDYLEKIESGEFSFKSEIYVKLFLKEYIRFVDFKKSDSITNEFNKILNKNSITIEPDLSSSSKVLRNPTPFFSNIFNCFSVIFNLTSFQNLFQLFIKIVSSYSPSFVCLLNLLIFFLFGIYDVNKYSNFF